MRGGSAQEDVAGVVVFACWWLLLFFVVVLDHGGIFVRRIWCSYFVHFCFWKFLATALVLSSQDIGAGNTRVSVCLFFSGRSRRESGIRMESSSPDLATLVSHNPPPSATSKLVLKEQCPETLEFFALKSGTIIGKLSQLSQVYI